MWVIVWGDWLYGPFKTADIAAKYAGRKLSGAWSLKKLLGPTP